MSELIPQMLQKAIEVIPGVRESDLMPFLLNSRALNAYDAVMLVASSANISSQQSDPVDPCLIVSMFIMLLTH